MAKRIPLNHTGRVCHRSRKSSSGAYPGAYLGFRQKRQRVAAAGVRAVPSASEPGCLLRRAADPLLRHPSLTPLGRDRPFEPVVGDQARP